MRQSKLTCSGAVVLLSCWTTLGHAQPSPSTSPAVDATGAPEPSPELSAATPPATQAEPPSPEADDRAGQEPDVETTAEPVTTDAPSASTQRAVREEPPRPDAGADLAAGAAPPSAAADPASSNDGQSAGVSAERTEVVAEAAPGEEDQIRMAYADPWEPRLVLPKPSQGHMIALGVHGVGAMASDDDRGRRKPTFGLGYSLRFGEAVTDWLDLSLSIAFSSTNGEAADKFSFGRLAVQSHWYFHERWFVQAGFGATTAQGADPEDLDRVRGRYGAVYLTGLGTNLYLSDSHQSGGWVVSPTATLEVGPHEQFTTAALWLGLEFSWWSGLSKDKLELPVSEAY